MPFGTVITLKHGLHYSRDNFGTRLPPCIAQRDKNSSLNDEVWRYRNYEDNNNMLSWFGWSVSSLKHKFSSWQSFLCWCQLVKIRIHHLSAETINSWNTVFFIPVINIVSMYGGNLVPKYPPKIVPSERSRGFFILEFLKFGQNRNLADSQNIWPKQPFSAKIAIFGR